MKIVGLADAGYFLDSPSINGEELWTPFYKNIARFQNVSKANDKDCINRFEEKNNWKCFMAENAIKFVDTPIFVVQSLTDSWQVASVFLLHCHSWYKLKRSFSSIRVIMN